MPAGVNGGGVGPLVVLKFGSSVLRGADGFRTAAGEVEAEVARGGRVVAIVSAPPGATDALLGTAVGVCASPPPDLLVPLLATGEIASVALLTMALRGIGVPARPAGAGDIGLRTRGPLLDAEPVDLDGAWVAASLQAAPVLVVPGFVGVDLSGRPSLLGRGGSDLTAVFLADRLAADECRLVKDVDGVYPVDPNAASDAGGPFESASWDLVLDLAATLVQPKAVRFARERGLTFRVCAPGGRGTRVGEAAEAVA